MNQAQRWVLVAALALLALSALIFSVTFAVATGLLGGR